MACRLNPAAWLLRRAKAIAAERGTSVSRLVDAYFQMLGERASQPPGPGSQEAVASSDASVAPSLLEGHAVGELSPRIQALQASLGAPAPTVTPGEDTHYGASMPLTSMPNRLKGLGSRALRDGECFTEVLHAAHAAGPKRSSRHDKARVWTVSSGPLLMDLHVGPPLPLLAFPLLLTLVTSTIIYPELPSHARPV